MKIGAKKAQLKRYWKSNKKKWLIEFAIVFFNRPSFWKFWKLGKYVHVEFIFSDGACCSSSGRIGLNGKPQGVRFAYLNLKLDHWDIFECPLSEGLESKLRAWCESKVGRLYDFLGIIGFRMFGVQDPDKDYCSEFLNHGLASIGKMLYSAMIGPNDFIEKWIALGYKQIS